ncbi:MAG TPA: hypothetical protein VFS27_03125 [Blastocatellia bacterium]|nr:hypothetical protein [Blastocatellia bacterium]
MAGQACNRTAKPQEVAKLKDEARPQAVKPKEAPTPQTANLANITLIEARELLNENYFMDETDITKIEEEITKTRAGEKWLGLYVTEGGSSLIESKLTVKPLLDPKDNKQEIGKVISVDQPAKPVFLVAGAAMLKPGPATTIYQGGEAKGHELLNTKDLASIKPRRLKLGDQEYQLKVVVEKLRGGGGQAEPADEDFRSVRMALVFGKQTQNVIEGSVELKNDIEVWWLLWAGDADGDGKLDLYYRSRSEEGGEHTSLYLSSPAKPGELLGYVADFTTIHGAR